jgi:hypothetical protein
MSLNSQWRGPQRQGREKDERDTTGVLILFSVPPKAKVMANRSPSFNLLLNVGTVGSMAISHLSAAATGTDDMGGTPMGPIQAVREDRPHGKIKVGDVVNKHVVGQQMTGEDLPPQVQLLLRRNPRTHQD